MEEIKSVEDVFLSLLSDLNEVESELKRYKELYELREEQLECAHKRIRDIKACQRYNFNGNGTFNKMRFGKWIKHEDMVLAAALPHPDDAITEAREVDKPDVFAGHAKEI